MNGPLITEIRRRRRPLSHRLLEWFAIASMVAGFGGALAMLTRLWLTGGAW